LVCDWICCHISLWTWLLCCLQRLPCTWICMAWTVNEESWHI
jgi:hypothetical protein